VAERGRWNAHLLLRSLKMPVIMLCRRVKSWTTRNDYPTIETGQRIQLTLHIVVNESVEYNSLLSFTASWTSAVDLWYLLLSPTK